MLGGAECAQRRERDLQQRQTHLGVQRLDQPRQPQRFFKHPTIGSGLQVRELLMPGPALPIEQQRIHDGPRAIRLARGGGQCSREVLDQTRGVSDVRLARLADAGHGACEAWRRRCRPHHAAHESRGARHRRARRDADVRHGHAFRKFAVPRRVDAPNTFLERRMRREQRAEPGCGTAEEQMARFGCIGVLNGRPLREPADLPERPREAVRLARELHG